MNELGVLLLALASGLLLGAIFFGGLWWTVRKSVVSQRPGLWFFCSLWSRLGIALAGFYLVGRDHWQPLLTCLLGFVIARLIVTRLADRPHGQHGSAAPETLHAP